MRAGALDRRIIIQQASESRTATGAATPSWSTFATVWASYEPTAGSERYASMQKEAKVNAVFTIRYLAGVIPKMRISYNGLLWDILDVQETAQRHRAMRIMAQAVT